MPFDSPVCVLGAGSWGTALAILLARNGNKTLLWGRDAEQIKKMQATRSNQKYLPDCPFPENLFPHHDLKYCLSQANDLLIVVPSHAFVTTLQLIKPLITDKVRIAWATKGLEPHSGGFLSDAIIRELNDKIPLAMLSGPTFAKELANNLPSACTLASNHPDFQKDFIKRLHNSKFRIYESTDLIGIQLGGAVKNIIAVGAGMGDGLGFGSNSRTALITRGLAELTRLGRSFSAEPHTLYGLSGLGDLLLTSTDDQSRNRRFGLAIGRGKSVDEAVEEIGQVVEAVRNTREVYELSKRLNIEMPIVSAIYHVLYENLSPQQAAHQLMTRALTDEEH